MEIRERLTDKARTQIGHLLAAVPEHFLEEGWVGGEGDQDRPDFVVQTVLRDAGIMGVWPTSQPARMLLSKFMGNQVAHHEGCEVAENPPLGVLTMSRVFACSLPVWEMLADEAQERGLSILIDPPRQEQGLKTDAEVGEGTVGPQPQGGEGIGPKGVLGFKFRINESGDLEVQMVGPDGEVQKPSEEEQVAGDLLEARARRISAVSRIRHIVPVAIGPDLQQGWYGAPRPEVPEGEKPPFSDVQAVMDGAGGMMMMHPHTDAGRAFMEALSNGTYNEVHYAYRCKWTRRDRDSDEERAPLEELDPNDPCPEYVVSLTSWPAIITFADVVANVTIHHSYDEEEGVPCEEEWTDD